MVLKSVISYETPRGYFIGIKTAQPFSVLTQNLHCIARWAFPNSALFPDMFGNFQESICANQFIYCLVTQIFSPSS
jgi:hypothetical protein